MVALPAVISAGSEPNRIAILKTPNILRKYAARNFEKICEALGNICELYTLAECRNFFKSAGYEAD